MPHVASPHPSAARPPVVLFDLDGTLIDTLELLVGAMQHAFADWSGPRPTVDEWVATIGRPLVWQFGQYASSPEQLQQLVQTYRAYQYAHHDRLTRAYPGIPEFLQRLGQRGHAMGVVTSKGDALANRSLAHVGLAPHFQVVVGADRTERHKPEPDPIRFALTALGRDPSDAVYIGDSPFDVMAANAAGVTSIAVTWGASAHDAITVARPRHVVGSVEALEGLLAKLAEGGAP